MEATDAMTDPIRVLLVDDEELMRAGLRLMIDGAAGIEVIGEAADGAQAVTQVSALDPDVVLMDVRMPGTDGIEATAQLTEHGSRARIVVLTAFDTDHFLLDALRAGAVSFLLKDSPPEDVVRAVHEAAEGQARFSPAVLRRLVRLAAGPRMHRHRPVPRARARAPRELARPCSPSRARRRSPSARARSPTWSRKG
jgi:DNA-binding NarL/FixJ family response regulator